MPAVGVWASPTGRWFGMYAGHMGQEDFSVEPGVEETLCETNKKATTSDLQLYNKNI